MDGRRHETSVRLIAASIPAQALMMAGVAALALGAASHGQPAPSIQVNPAQVTKPAPAYVDPLETCWPRQPAGATSAEDGKQAVLACSGLQSESSPYPDKVTFTTVAPCCGG